MPMRVSISWIAMLVLVAALSPTRILAKEVDYTLTIENNTELNLTISVLQNSSEGLVPRWDKVLRQYDVKPVSISTQKFKIAGRTQIVFEPSRCGNPKAFPVLKQELWALPNQTSKYYMLKDSDFGKSLILPQCPERLADSELCIRARGEVARLEALRQEPEQLTKYGWDLSGRITLPGSTQTVYDRIVAIEREKEPRLRANPMAASTDPVYRRLTEEQNRLKDAYNARMAELIRQEPELVRRNVTDVNTLKARIADAQTKWQAEGQQRYPQATAERDRVCASR